MDNSLLLIKEISSIGFARYNNSLRGKKNKKLTHAQRCNLAILTIKAVTR